MATVDITEFQRIARTPQGKELLVGEFPATNQQVAIGAGSVQSAAFASGTTLIRVHTDAICRIAFGDAPVAGPTTPRMAAGSTEYFGVKPGHKIAIITAT
jgi:hypothetical protein